MFFEQEPRDGGERQKENSDFPYEENNNFPYSDYYRSKTGSNQVYIEEPRRNRSWVVVLVCIIMVLTAAISTFLTNFEFDIDNSGGGLSITLSRKEAEPESSTSAVEEPLPSLSISNSADLEQAQPVISRGDGTTLIISDVGDDSEVLTLKEIYAKVSPSVVSVICTDTLSESSGTGIIMSSDGYIITNYHVVSGSRSIAVETEGGDEYIAVLVGSDEISDLAVIKIDAVSLTAAVFGRSDSLAVGDEVSAIGNPLGSELRGTFTNGIISAINRDIEVDGRKMTLIQTNAALNAGNSGGPLINSYGQVIGVNTMKMRSYYSTVEGLGFAIPISLAKPIIDELIEKGYVSGRAAIGITGEDLPASTAAYYRMPQGVYVTIVDERSDAYTQGLRPKDIIVAVNDTSVTSMSEVKAIKNNFSAGETIKLTYYHPSDGELYEINVILMDQADLSDN